MEKKLLSIFFIFSIFFLSSWSGFGQDCPEGTTAPGANAAVSITQNVGSTNICSDETVSFSGNINTDGGSSNYTLQWQVKLNSGAWTDITSVVSTEANLTNYSPAVGNNALRLKVTFCDGTIKHSNASSIITVNQVKTGSVTISASKTTICPGENINFTAPSPANAGSSPGYQWKVNGTTQGTSASFSSSTIPDGANVQLFITSSLPCVEPFSSNVINITHKPGIPDTPGTITGDDQICSNTSGITYSIDPVTRATSYQWTLPSGWSGSSTSNSITVTSGNVGGNQTIKVKAINECGQSQDQTLSINVGPGKPATPSAISDPGLICPNSSITLNVPNDPAVNSYTWEVPTGWIITGGQGSNQITVTAGSYGQNGTVSVYSTNECLDSDKSTKNFSINEPAPVTPGTIDGNALICPNINTTYSITAVQYADEYIWYFDGAEISGQNGTSVTLNSGDYSASPKEIKVIALNECSPSDHSTIAGSTKSITVDDGTPDATSISETNGDQNFCPGQLGITFSVPTNAKIDTYSWQVPTNWSVTSGAGTNQITVTAGQLGNDGQITFTGSSNDCGSVSATYDVFVKDPAPVVTSETITGETEVCHDATGLTYSIPAIQYATNYTWSKPDNWSIDSGQGSNSITVSAGTDDGIITVIASNDCGDSYEITLEVSSVDAAPLAPGTITSVALANGALCPPTIVDLDFSIDPVTGADYYEWEFPNSAWVITSSDPQSNSITVKVDASAQHPNPSNVKVRAVNICGESPFTSSIDIAIDDYVQVNAGSDQTLCKVASPVTINGNYSFGGTNKNLKSTWSTSGSGSFGSATKLGTTYTPSQADLNSGSVTLTLTTEAPSGACGPGKDELMLFFRQDPTASISATAEICTDQTAEVTFTATANTTVTYKIGTGSNQTVQVPDSGTATVTTNTLTSNTTISLVSIQYTQAPSCSKTLTGSATVTVNAVPYVDISYNITYCQTDTAASVSFANQVGAWDGGSFSSTGSLSSAINSSDGSFNPSVVGPGTYTITYTIPASGGCGEVSVTTDVTILKEVTITQQPAANRICERGNAHFEVSATGDGLTYQWYKGSATAGNEIDGAISATLDISNISATDAGDYYVIVSGASPCSPVTSEAGTLTVDQDIVVDTQPQQQIICENSSATFSFTATSGGAALSSEFTYQWYKGTPGSGTPVSSATSNELTIASATPEDNGDYYVEISGSSDFQCEPTLSEAATLTVRPTPTVTISGDAAICSGTSADITFTDGIPNGIVTYTINNDNNNLKTFALDASGEGTLNTGNLFATDSPDDTDDYLDDTDFNFEIQSVAYSNTPECISDVEGSAIITVSPVPNPEISFPYNQIEFCTADGGTFTPSLNGQGTFTGGTFSANGGLNINSSTGAFIPSGQNAGEYTITYSYPTAGGCSEGSATLNISIYEEVAITSHPFNLGICSTQDAEFSVTATGDDLSYQWYKDGNALTGETAATLSLPIATSENAGEYYVIVSGTNACTPTEDSAVESEHAFLTVDEDIVILEPAEDISVCETGEETVTFRFIAHANGKPLKFKWIYSNGQSVPIDGTKIKASPVTDTLYGNLGFSSFTGTLTINNIVEADEAEYAVEIDGSENNFNCPIAVSNAFKLEVNPLPDGPVVENVEYCTGDVPVALTAIGDDLKWYDEDMNPLSNAPVPPVSDTETEFTYYVTQTPLYCESEPSEIKVFVYARPGKPAVAETELNYCLGETALQLEATPDDTENYSLNWYDSETSTTPLDQAPTPQTTSKGTSYFWVSQTNANDCEGERKKITIFVHDLPNITPPEDQTICEGNEITLTANDENINDDSTNFTWVDTNNNTLTGSSITITPSETVTYTITGTNSNGCTNTKEVTITVDPKPEGGILDGPESVCETNPSGEITLSDHFGTIDRWEYKNSTTDWTVIANTAGLDVFDFTSLDIAEATTFRAILTNGVCNEVPSTEISVYIDPEPVGGELAFEGHGRTIETCSNPGPDYDIPLTLSGQTGEIIRWRFKEGSAAEWSAVMENGEAFTGTTLTPALIRSLGINQSTIFEVEMGSGACSPNVFSQNATLGIVSSDIAPNPVSVTPGVVCLGEEVTLSGSTGYGTGPGMEAGSFDFSSITNKGWRIKDKNGVESNFDSSADNGVASIWLRTNPLPLTTAYLTGSYNTYTYSNWDSSAGDEGNKGFAVVSGPNPSTLETSVFNLFAVDNPVLIFDQAYNLTPGSAIYVDISTDGGATYTTENILFELVASDAQDGTSGNYDSFGDDDASAKNKMSLDLTEYANFDNLRIRFRYEGTRPGDVWAVDAISLPVEPTNVDLIWTDYTDPNNPVVIGTNNSEQWAPTLVGWNDFEIRTRLTFDSTGAQCPVVENWKTISVFVFDQYTSTATAVAGACGTSNVPLNATVLNSQEVDVAGTKTLDGYEGQWEVVSGPSNYNFSPSHFSNANSELDPIKDPAATFTPGVYGDFTLRWVLSTSAVGADGKLLANETCPPTYNDVSFSILDCTALDFDGFNDYVDLGTNYTGSNYSIEAWIRPFDRELEAGGQTNANNGTIISGPGFEIKMQDLPTTISPNGRWYHIAYTNDDKLYIDGILQASNNISGVGGSQTLIGARWNSSDKQAENHFSGWIEEVRIWNTPLTSKQIRFLMNQRIQVKANAGDPIEGEIIGVRDMNSYRTDPAGFNLDKDDDKWHGLNWENLAGYYRLISQEPDPANLVNFDVAHMPANGLTPNLANAAIPGRLINMETNQQNTAPLPYFTGNNGGDWDVQTTWARTVWNIPNTAGMEWNIVKLSDPITSERTIKVLGLVSEVDTFTMVGTNPSQWLAGASGTGNPLHISHYLLLNGVIDLDGESQLIQPEGSLVDFASGGELHRDQQGTALSYNYNYWSSPVSPGTDNADYSIDGVMRDGTGAPANPPGLAFGPAGDYTWADGGYTTPRRVSSYWLNIFHGRENVYGDWVRITKDATFNVGEGYTMKGTSGGAAWADSQNYTFVGIPNNGDVTLSITPNQSYLIGNPYPSAINSDQFIRDNLSSVAIAGGTNSDNVFNGTLYFWSHFGGKTHMLKEYEGGYAVYNISGGIRAINTDDRILNSNNEGGAEPQPYIPVGQSFFVTSVSPHLYNSGPNVTISPGDIIFKNSQRHFKVENVNESVFHKQEVSAKESQDTRDHTDTRPKIWLKFHSPKGYHREILVAADANSTNGFDLGYDAPLIEYNVEDMFWLLGSAELVIQGVPDFNKQRIIPLGLVIDKKENFTIKIEKLMNFDDKTPIYLKDKLNDSIHNLRTSEYVGISEPGYINERFEIIFENPKEEPVDPGEEEEEIVDGIELNLRHGYINREIQILNPEQILIDNMYIFDMNGNKLHDYNSIPNSKEVRVPVRNYSSGVYIVRLHAGDKIIKKKIIISN